MGRKVRAAVAATLMLPALAVPLTATPAAAAASLPPGFVQTVRSSGHSPFELTAFDVLPDGGLLTASKAGKVVWVSPDDTEQRDLKQLTVRNMVDIGLVGLTTAPDYAVTGTVFTVHAYSDAAGNGWHRLTEWAVDAPTAPTALQDERIILDGIEVGPSNVHGATDVLAATDGTLWLSIGDGGDSQRVDPVSFRSLDPDDPHGKVLRLRRDGSGVVGNPYYDAAAPTAWRSLVYASGFRSPFRFTLDPRTGGPIVADVGWNGYEEIDVLRPGASYGWPCWEGPQQTPGYKDLPGCAGVGHAAPAWSYPRTEGVSVTGGVFYDGDSWPEQYRGTYMFGDYASKRLWTARIGTDGTFTGAPVPFGSDIGGPVHFRAAANGDIMYADIYTGRIVRLSYAPGNRKPTPLVTTKTDPTTRTVQFDASGSSDLDGDELSFGWDFGDETVTDDIASGATVSYTYPAGTETFAATLTLADSQGGAVRHAVTVAPGNHEPTLDVRDASGTGPDGTFVVGDQVTLTATATDVEDGPLPIAWTSALVHCRGTSCHDHPSTSAAGSSFSTVFEDHGGDTRLVVRATAEDRNGARSTHEFTAQPSLRQLSVQANTPVLVTVNGVAAASALVAEGSTNSVSVPATATDGVATLSAWEDGSTARVRQVVVGAQDIGLAVTFTTPIDRRYGGDAGLRSAIGAPLSLEQGSADLRWRDYERARLYWTPQTGVRVLVGDIRARFLRLGGHVAQGVPLTDELGTPDGIGRYVHFSGGVSIYWTPRTGAHAVGGAVRQRWEALGWERGPLGYPVTDELSTADGVGRYNHFSNAGSIFWTPGTGAHGIWGAIRQRWEALGREAGALGYPVTSESVTPDGVGRYNHFSKAGSVYWTPGTGAHGVWGAIRQRWEALGWETGPLGYPVTSELSTPDGVGRYNHFSTGSSIYWTPRTGAHGVWGAIRQRWAALGWERSYLGYRAAAS